MLQITAACSGPVFFCDATRISTRKQLSESNILVSKGSFPPKKGNAVLKSQTLLKEILVTKVSSGMVFLNLLGSGDDVTNLGFTITLKAFFSSEIAKPRKF